MLEVCELRAGYGKVEVLKGISLHVDEGEAVTLIGSNGAGKSTLLKVLSGLLPAWSGSLSLSGRDLASKPSHKRVAEGLVMVPEGRMLFASMTVEENLRLGAYSRKGSDLKRLVSEEMTSVFELFPVLGERKGQTASTLSGGEQQMLAIGRALMAGPRLLLLDEPSLGLAPMVIKEIFAALEELRRRGLTLLLVEQDARVALKHADRGYVLRTGEIALQGTAAELMADDDVRLIYLGAWQKP
ncbi:MAG: ABC transporter ATP-binding protein [Actinobacteria bacterium]|nr:MAG: ABC transporter ATP-binding protein [Actinomycetota bacterium]